MKNTSSTYRILTKSTAILLLMAFLIPGGLHAKQLVDFCKTELGSHNATEMPHHSDEMAADHSCCESETEEKEKQTDSHTHHDCDWGFICACSIGQSQLGDEEWIPTTKNLEIALTQQGDVPPFFTSGDHILADQQIRIGQYDPPLWLLYDTFLM
ncbi:hypothetical protein [Rhodohalobacter sp. SW132]|uniref:hypothetical protein n=1 Tax=Rhodohalobacter sp. SW132 TaxID=2293433 RepID=UPI0011C04A7D|nr:hypothetical protein [Rhodohalobacter sp. SW132]